MGLFWNNCIFYGYVVSDEGDGPVDSIKIADGYHAVVIPYSYHNYRNYDPMLTDDEVKNQVVLLSEAKKVTPFIVPMEFSLEEKSDLGLTATGCDYNIFRETGHYFVQTISNSTGPEIHLQHILPIQ